MPVILHKEKLFDAQRQENLLQNPGFLPLLFNFPSKHDFVSPVDFLHNEFALYMMHFNFSSLQTHFYKVLVTFSKTLFFNLKYEFFLVL